MVDAGVVLRSIQARAGARFTTIFIVEVSCIGVPSMRAQVDENECRKPFTPSEGVAKGRPMEPMLKAEAKERQGSRGDIVENFHDVDAAKTPDAENYRNGSTGETRDQVGAAVGMSGRTYEKANTPQRATG